MSFKNVPQKIRKRRLQCIYGFGFTIICLLPVSEENFKLLTRSCTLRSIVTDRLAVLVRSRSPCEPKLTLRLVTSFHLSEIWDGGQTGLNGPGKNPPCYQCKWGVQQSEVKGKTQLNTRAQYLMQLRNWIVGYSSFESTLKILNHTFPYPSIFKSPPSLHPQPPKLQWKRPKTSLYGPQESPFTAKNTPNPGFMLDFEEDQKKQTPKFKCLKWCFFPNVGIYAKFQGASGVSGAIPGTAIPRPQGTPFETPTTRWHLHGRQLRSLRLGCDINILGATPKMVGFPTDQIIH